MPEGFEPEGHASPSQDISSAFNVFQPQTRRAFLAGSSMLVAATALGSSPLRAFAGNGIVSSFVQILIPDEVKEYVETEFEVDHQPTEEFARNERLLQAFIDMYSDTLMTDSVYAYPSFVVQYRQNKLANFAVNLADFLVHTGSNEPDKDTYVEVLVDLIATYDAQNSGDVLYQRSLDDLKTGTDYLTDIAEMGADFITVYTGVKPTTGIQDGLAAAIDLLANTVDGINGSIDEVRRLTALCKNYADYTYLLDAIAEASGGDLAAAAREVDRDLETAFEARLKLIVDNDVQTVGRTLPGYTETLFDDALIPFLKQSNNYRDGGSFTKFVDRFDYVLTRFNLLQDSWDLGTKIGTLIGDVAVGGEDLILRLRQLCAIYDVSAVLVDKLALLEGTFEVFRGTVGVWDSMDEYVHIAEFLVACRLRGEYSIYSIVAEDAGLLSLINSSNAEEARQWYGRVSKKLSSYQNALPPILFTGIGVLNNGGLFVGTGGDVYYWRLSETSVQSTGIYGAFSREGGTENDLICRNAQGAEKVLLRDAADGQLWFSYGCLFYRHDGSEMMRLPLDGGEPLSIGTHYNGCFVDDLSGVFVCTIDGTMVGIDKDGAVTTLAGKQDGDSPMPLCAYDGMVYYCYRHAEDDDESYSVHVRSVRYNGTDDTFLGTVYALAYPSGGLSVRAQVQFGWLYISFANVAGTGLFYSQGGAARIPLEGMGAFEMLVSPFEGDVMGSDMVVIAADPVDDGEGGTVAGTHRLYYLADSEYSGAGSNLQPWISGTIWSVDVETGEKAPASDPSFVLSGAHSYAFIDGDLMVLLDDGLARYHLVASAARFDEEGYVHMQDFSFEGANEDGAEMSFMDAVDVVGDVAYITVHRCARNHEEDVGWRAGYTRIESRVYQTVIGSDKLELVYAY
ncbi:MAG: hypothetical protein IKE43_04040 [Coriobacteriales bacterium]|nr:hypothetical protein [Coriobacteriales bacterium]